MSFLDDFAEEMNTEALILEEGVTIINGRPHTDFVQVGDPIKGFLDNLSISDRYYSQQIQADVQSVFITYPVELKKGSRLRINGIDYALDLGDDVGSQGESMEIGLHRIKE